MTQTTPKKQHGQQAAPRAWRAPDAAPRPSDQPQTDPEREQVLGQLKVWREHLVDLTRRNPLLGINRARISKLQVEAPSSSELFDALIVRGTALRLPLVRKRPSAPAMETPADGQLALHAEKAVDDEGAARQSVWLLQPGDIEFEAEPADLYRRLRRIKDNARTTVEERGVTTLHLTLGAVEWEDQLLGPSVAPLWLIPCAFESTGPDEPLLLVATDEDPQLNPALEIFLRDRYKKSLPSLPEEPSAGVINALLRHARQSLSEEFHVTDQSWLSTFSFETLAMYQDLGALAEAAVAHDVVRAFSRASVRDDAGASERIGDDLDTDDTGVPLPVPVLPADSSQLESLGYARQGRHLLVHGPPGTGKSQTISNLIGDALGQGKTVLFVSAKMAALEVVHDRLSKLGFGRFCLEAHSTKAGKARIIDELRRALDAAGQMNGADHTAELTRHAQLRASLNNVVRELHRRREPMGRSVYQGLGQFALYEQLPALQSDLPWQDLTTVDNLALQEVLDILADLKAESTTFAERETHPWRGCVLEDSGHATSEALLGALAATSTAQAAVIENSTLLVPFVGPLQERSFSGLAHGADALSALAEATWLPQGWTSAAPKTLSTRAAELRAAAETVRKLAALRADFADKTEGGDPTAARELLSTGLDRFGAWYKRLRPAYFTWKNEVRRQVRPKASDYGSLADLARLVDAIAVEAKVLEADRPDVEPLLAASAGPWPDVDALDEAAFAFERAAAIRNWRPTLGTNSTDTNGEPIIVDALTRDAAHTVLSYLPGGNAQLTSALDYLHKAWGGAFVGGLPPEDVPLGALGTRCAEAHAAPLRLGEWVVLREILDRCNSARLEPFITALTAYGSSQAVDLFRRRFWLLWSDAHIARVPSLRLFSGSKREEVVREFAAVDQRLRKLAVASAIDGAAQRASQIKQTSYANRESQLGILQRELQKKRPRPLRKLFADIPHVLQAIKPCMLMSPVSVSTYLTPGTIDFDIVVFDEASQLRPAEAIPSILRARQVIVAGDDKQLPPMSFFSSSLFAEETDDETEDAKPLESLLRECEAAAPFFQLTSLKWHYRSRDERLIAFSNHTFYEGSLITFPSPGGPPDRGVQLRFVDNGVWDRGKSRTNRVEARIVADLITRHLDEHPDRSIGVAALNISQKEAIEDALEEALALRADLRARLFDEEAPEPFFIKSLENVQGDERDTIIISTGYGPDANGNVNLNFGPLNQEGGWRRLNVLVTRAKYLTILVTSLRSSDLRAVSPDNRGATALRQFIEYAEHGGRIASEGTRLTKVETNDFEDAIAEALRARGLEIDEQVGASSFRIDLAIRDPRDRDWYVLGVECDGATYHSSRTARDRDVLRADMLRNMGWHLHRIWSVDWFRNPQQAVDSVLKSVERAMALGAPGAGVPVPAVETIEAPVVAVVRETVPAPPSVRQFSEGQPYSIAAPPRYAVRSRLLEWWATADLADEIVRVVATESPIHPDLALRRVAKQNGVERAGSNVKANFSRALAAAVTGKQIVKDKRGFLWAPGARLATFRFATGDEDLRKIDHVAAEEIGLAIMYVVETQFGLPQDKLVSETATELGYRRTGADIADAINQVIEDLIDKGELRRSGFQITLP